MHASAAASRRALPARVLLLLVGLAISAYGYLLTVVASLGNGPLFALQDGLGQMAGLPAGTMAIVVGLALVVVAVALRAPLGPGTIAIPVLFGVAIGLLEPLVSTPTGLVDRWLALIIGTNLLMGGGAMAVHASFGASALEGATLAIERRGGIAQARSRTAMEITFTVIGAALGGAIGVGTLFIGVTVGPIYSFWLARIERLDARRTLPARVPALDG